MLLLQASRSPLLYLMKLKSNTSKAQTSKTIIQPSIFKDFPALRCETKTNEKDCLEVYIQLHIKPGAKLDQLMTIHEAALDVQIAAPPTDGEANKRVVQYFSELLSIPKSNITLIRGHKSREKTISVKYPLKMGITDPTNSLNSILTCLKENCKGS
ncbi:hypothetical protein HMI54_009692 [Coelomomyces lativittatus]|nr:hypothetical protein HMI56_003539 [Coelomomyces lativittatus]KAJ1501780.1 hypothetical protein HMI54_009692 [Coelomomyces lativittatus]